MPTTGDTLKQLAADRNMSLQTVARVLGVSVQTVSRWANDRVDMPLDQRLRVADLFSVDPEVMGASRTMLPEAPAPAWALELIEEVRALRQLMEERS